MHLSCSAGRRREAGERQEWKKGEDLVSRYEKLARSMMGGMDGRMRRRDRPTAELIGDGGDKFRAD